MLNRPATVYPTEEKAQEAADLLMSGEDEGWTYKVNPDPKGSGRAIVEIYDESGEFVGYI